MSERYTTQEITEVPTKDIAHQRARIAVIDDSSQETFWAHDRDAEQAVWCLAEATPTYAPEYWESAEHRHKTYEEYVVHTLSGISTWHALKDLDMLTFKPLADPAAMRPLAPEETDPSLAPNIRNIKRDAAQREYMGILREQARVDAAVRSGFAEATTLEDKRIQLAVPLATVAALCFQRASIHQPIDRALYDREQEILDATDDIFETAATDRIGAEKVARLQGRLKTEAERGDLHRAILKRSELYRHDDTKVQNAKMDSITSPYSTNDFWKSLNANLATLDQAYRVLQRS